MADQTIEIRLVVRDELTRALDDAFARMRRHDAAINTQVRGAEQGFQGLGRGAQFVRREFSALGRLTFGGLIGGGVVAGIAATAKALSDMAARSQRLHYTAQGLNVSVETLSKFSVAMQAMGQSEQEGAQNVERALSTLQELKVLGPDSPIAKQLESLGGQSGKNLAIELRRSMMGPNGPENTFRLLLQRMSGMKPESQRKLAEIFGLGTISAKDYLAILPQLHKRLELSAPQARALSIANTNLQTSWHNIQLQLATAFIPIFEKLASSLDKFLQSPSGKEFTKRIEEWGAQLNKTLDEWLQAGGLNAAANALEESVDLLSTAFTAADKVVQDMGVSWKQVIGTLVTLKFGAWLWSLVAPLTALTRIPQIIALLALIAAGKAVYEKWGEDPAETARRIEEMEQWRKGKGPKDSFWSRPFNETVEQTLKWLWDLRGGKNYDPNKAQPQSYTPEEGAPRTPAERRADADERRRANRQLNEELGKTIYSFAKLNDVTMPGGPEGGAGPSGFQFDVDYANMPVIGPAGGGRKRRPYPILPPQATPLTAIPGTERPAQSAGTGFASWYGNRPDLGFIDPRDKGRLGVEESEQGIALGPRETLGSYHYLTDPFTGLTHVVRQSDVGPNIRTQKLLDIHASQLARMGYTASLDRRGRTVTNFPSGRGLWQIEPAFPAFSKEPSGLDYRPNYAGGITNELATRDSAGLNGSANIEIDVSSLGGGGARNSDDLFRTSALGGHVQMLDPPRSYQNPTSAQQ